MNIAGMSCLPARRVAYSSVTRPTKSLDGHLVGSLNPYHNLPVLSPTQIVASGAQTRLTTLKSGPQNDDGPPKQAVGVKRLSSLERLVDYGTDDEDMVEGPSPLHTAASFIAAPRSQEAPTEDTREGETTTTANDSVMKRESPTDNGPKVCAPNGFSKIVR